MNLKQILTNIIGSLGIGVFIQLIALLRTAQLANYFGTTNNMDAYNLANIITVCVVNIIGTSVGVIIIPFITNKKEYSLRTLNNYITFLITSTFCLMVVIYICCYIYLFKMNISHSDFDYLTFKLSLILGIGQFIRLFSSILTAKYQVENKYIVTKKITLVSSLLPFLFFLFFPTKSIMVVAITFTISYFLEWFCLKIFLGTKYKYFLTLDFKDPKFKKLVFLTWPILVNSFVYQLVIILPNTILHSFGEGYVSSMTYSNQIISTIQTLIIINSVNILYPIITKNIYINKSIGIKKSIDYITYINLLIIPIVFGVIVLGKELISLLFQRGSFDHHSIQLVYLFLILSSIQLPLIVFREILSKILFSLDKTTIIVKVSLFSIFMEIIFLVLFKQVIGVYVIVASPLVSQLIYILTLLTYLKKVEKENISFNKITTQHLIIIFCSFFMFLGLLFLKQAVPFFSIPVFALIILPLLGTIIYGLLMLLFQKEFCKKIIKELLN
ncbi:lipid II flippase MurJ [Enterococcus lactis]|uniref:lipid II flippase MurJ n=1 Tax=Enterococcus TaxID=1350 RepID=UPI0015E3EB2B|nr:lipid II flippase MurJ [Enterococcus faecium]MBS6012491.1 polysaccharide biosynthesis C-terminal domain-containing protein [Enterococcus faecium]